MKFKLGYKDYYINKGDIERMVEIDNLNISQNDAPLDSKEKRVLERVYFEMIKQISKRTKLSPYVFAIRVTHSIDQELQAATLGKDPKENTTYLGDGLLE